MVLADRAYCAYVDMTFLLQRNVFSVVRLRQRRKSNFRTGKRLGADDRLVNWPRPKQWKPSMKNFSLLQAPRDTYRRKGDPRAR